MCSIPGNLVLKGLKHTPEILEPVAADLFYANMGTIRFERDARKNIAGILLTTGRSRNLRFVKE
jgi:hypothetical protein